MSDDEENGFRGHENMEVPLPIRGIDKVLIPQLFIKRVGFKTGEYERNENGKFKKDSKGKKIPILKYGFTIDIQGNESINKTRQISSRKGKPVLDLKTAKVEKVVEQRPAYMPRLAEFPKLKDRRIIYNYLTHLHPKDQLDFPHNKTRGLPPILPKNWKHHNLGAFPKGYKGKEGKEKKVSHEDIFGSDSESDENPEIESVSENESESESDEEKDAPSPKASKQRATPSQGGAGGGKKGRGRPRKHMTAQEAYDAKIKSNKDKRAERAKEARRLKIQEKLSKGQKLTKKERELHEAEGSGIKEDTIKNYGMVLKHLEGHITDPKEPVDKKDYLQSNKIIKAIKKIKGGDTDPCWKDYEMVGMKTKKGKKVPNCVPTGEGLDFDKVKWGTFKALYNRFLKKNPDFKDKIEDLEHFAHFVVLNPEKFSKVAHKKALFYQNIIEKK